MHSQMDSGTSSRLYLFLLSTLFVFKSTFSLNETNNEINLAPPVNLIKECNQVVVYNGFVKLTLSSPGGLITGIQYNGIENILATSEIDKANSGYWDCNWASDTASASVDRQEGTNFEVISNTSDLVEISFTRTWKNSSQFPMNVDKRFIMLRGASGFYTYLIYEHSEALPRLKINQLRIVFKLKDNLFKYVAVSDSRQKIMPTSEERANGTVLDYKEAVRLKNGEVDDKYQYSSTNKDNHLHGWIADNPASGFWIITPSDEFRVGGPLRQELTSHTPAVSLSMFVSSHYASKNFSGISIEDKEPWKKVFGPIFVYLNSGVEKDHRRVLWENAKSQMVEEMMKWPYDFPLSVDYLKSNQRGSLLGQLKVLDRYINEHPQPAQFGHVGLALPGEVGSWENETKGYQFWAQTDSNGSFVIKEARPGTYNLYGWVPGFIGEYKYVYPIEIKPGGVVELKGLVFEPPKNGPTLWEIGYPDRLPTEFYIPDVDPYYINKLYLDFDKFRQYRLWQRYTELYPKNDIIFTIGVSNYSRDWFYAHVQRMNQEGKNLTPTTWKIVFELETVEQNKNYTLRLAFASATYGTLQISVNAGAPIHTIESLGNEYDNAIARHGSHGVYHVREVKIGSGRLLVGKNTISLSLAKFNFTYAGVMYDYIRLEGPPN